MKQKFVNTNQIKLLLKNKDWHLRNDLRPVGVDNDFVELNDGRLLSYWKIWDEKIQDFSDKKLKGWVVDTVQEYINWIAEQQNRVQPIERHVLYPHKRYFQVWDESGKNYINDLTMALHISIDALDFTKRSLDLIDISIKSNKLPNNVLQDSIFLPAVVGYCGIYLQKAYGGYILIEYIESDDIYEPYYVNNSFKTSMYIPFFEEALENSRNFSVNFIIDVNF